MRQVISIAPFGDAYEKIGTIQRRLAWPLHKDDTLFQSGRPTGLNIYFIFSYSQTVPSAQLASMAVDACGGVVSGFWLMTVTDDFRYLIYHIQRSRQNCRMVFWKSKRNSTLMRD